MGLLLVYTWFHFHVWVGVFFGWAVKNVLVFVGGARLYGAARPFFIGLILGEMASAVFWRIVNAILAGLGLPYISVEILPS